MEHRGFNVMLLTETKIQLEVYLQNRIRYDATCLAAQTYSAGGAQGGVGLVTREMTAVWGIESILHHSPNVVSYDIVTVLNRTPLVGLYLFLPTLEHLPDLEEAVQRFRDPFVLVDLNVDLEKARSLWI